MPFTPEQPFPQVCISLSCFRAQILLMLAILELHETTMFVSPASQLFLSFTARFPARTHLLLFTSVLRHLVTFLGTVIKISHQSHCLMSPKLSPLLCPNLPPKFLCHLHRLLYRTHQLRGPVLAARLLSRRCCCALSPSSAAGPMCGPLSVGECGQLCPSGSLELPAE